MDMDCWLEVAGRRRVNRVARDIWGETLKVLIVVLGGISIQFLSSTSAYADCRDYLDEVRPAVEARVAEMHAQWAEEQRALFAHDPFEYAKERASHFMQDGRADGLDPESPEYARVALEANLEAQRTLSGGGRPLSVMSNADRERFKMMLFGREGTDGPLDPQSSYRAIRELIVRYQDISHLRIAFSELGMNTVLADVFKAIRQGEVDLIRVGVLASTQTIDEQSQYAAMLLHINQDSERSKRDRLKNNIYDSEWIRTIVASGWDDPVQQQRIIKAVDVIATMLMATGISVDDFCTIVGVPPDRSLFMKYIQKIYGWLFSGGQQYQSTVR